MKVPKATDAAKSRFDRLVPAADPRVEVKPMFGNLGAFVNGNMFMGIFGSDIGLKLPSSEQESLRAIGGHEFGPVERPMGGYVTLPESLDAERAQAWVSRSVDYVGALPAKVKKK
jgi:TfoX/Sxy family transcriptional regulator of competence genes